MKRRVTRRARTSRSRTRRSSKLKKENITIVLVFKCVYFLAIAIETFL